MTAGIIPSLDAVYSFATNSEVSAIVASRTTLTLSVGMRVSNGGGMSAPSFAVSAGTRNAMSNLCGRVTLDATFGLRPKLFYGIWARE